MLDEVPGDDSAAHTGPRPDTGDGADTGGGEDLLATRDRSSAGCGGASDFGSIGEALAHTVEGGTVEVCGRHVENLVLGRSVSLVGRDGAVLEGVDEGGEDGAASVITSSENALASVSIEGLTVVAPVPEMTAIDFRTSELQLTVVDSVILGGSGAAGVYFGGAHGVVNIARTVFLSSAVALFFMNTPGLSMSLDEITVQEHSGQWWSGGEFSVVRLVCYTCDTPAEVTITNSQFSNNNEADAVIEVGGATFVTITGSSITDNVTLLGALYSSVGAEGMMEVVASEILRNDATREGNGGALLMYAGELRSVESDWGRGEDDNLELDLLVDWQEYDYGTNASFYCHGELGCE